MTPCCYTTPAPSSWEEIFLLEYPWQEDGCPSSLHFTLETHRICHFRWLLAWILPHVRACQTTALSSSVSLCERGPPELHFELLGECCCWMSCRESRLTDYDKRSEVLGREMTSLNTLCIKSSLLMLYARQTNDLWSTATTMDADDCWPVDDKSVGILTALAVEAELPVGTSRRPSVYR